MTTKMAARILQNVTEILHRFSSQKRGVTSIEYGLLAGFIGLGLVNILYITHSASQIPLLSVYGDIYNAILSA
jgi:Flp pilus assembly pilin Flp